MSDKPILFSAPMVRALFDGRKTQTRRVLKPQPEMLDDGQCRFGGHMGPADYLMREIAPRFWAKYRVGDRLWVRETWAPLDALTHGDPGAAALAARGFYRADNSTVDGEIAKWRPAIHMPRRASRLTLIVTSVKIERLQDTTNADAIAEGALEAADIPYIGGMTCDQAREAFRLLWESINGQGSWELNPWVVALTFRVIKANIDALEAMAA